MALKFGLLSKLLTPKKKNSLKTIHVRYYKSYQIYVILLLLFGWLVYFPFVW